MGVVVSFTDYIPPVRFDEVPWETIDIYELAAADALEADWTLIDTVTIDPVDADPSDPASRTFTTDQGTDEGLWYRVRFVDGAANVSSPTDAVQNVEDPVTPYATVDELARILKIRNPTDDQTTAMERVLMSAAGEIDAEIDLAGGSLTGWQLDLAAEVNLERAVEHWRQQESPFGLLSAGVDVPAERAARDSWERHALKLAPLKQQFGLA